MSSRVLTAVAVIVSAGLGVGAGYAIYKRPWKAQPATVAPPAASVAPSASAPAPSASAVSSADELVATTSRDEALVCLKGMFAEGTFTGDAGELEIICKDTNAITITKRVKELVVKSGVGQVSPGMKEWAVLGFHEIAAIAVLRGRCCPAAPALEVPVAPGACEPLADALADIAATSRPGVSDTELDAAAARFDKDAQCIVKSEQTAAFGGYKSIDGGETTMFKKLMHRAQGAAPTKK